MSLFRSEIDANTILNPEQKKNVTWQRLPMTSTWKHLAVDRRRHTSVVALKTHREESSGDVVCSSSVSTVCVWIVPSQRSEFGR